MIFCLTIMTFPLIAGENFILENGFLKVDLNSTDGTFSVLDKRSDRIWTQRTMKEKCQPVSPILKIKNGLSFDCRLQNHSGRYSIDLLLDTDKPELTVRLRGAAENPIKSPIYYPAPFESLPGDRIIFPMNEGISWPAEEQNIQTRLTPYYSGHGVCMAFWGQQEERTAADGSIEAGSALLAICETPDNSCEDLLYLPADKIRTGSDLPLLSVRQVWGADRGRFGYDRATRFVFFDHGGYVALAKRYREQAKIRGFYIPFTEKIKRNPAYRKSLEKLIGAANIWCLSGEFVKLYDEISGNHPATPERRKFMLRQLEIYREMRDNGMDRLIIGAGADADLVQKINELGGTLTSRYDIYQDVMNPARYKDLTAIKNEWARESYPKDLRVNQDGSLAKGWAVPQKNKDLPMVSCNHLCDRQALPYARKRISGELQKKPYTARFIDVTACSGWSECYSKDHPMNKTESRLWKERLLELPGKEFNLVLGSETGHEAFVPACDYFEGMMSLIHYRVPDSGRNMAKIWDQAPEPVAKFQTGEFYRIPLWELVYHECVVSYWYWGDYNNKLPALMDKRDLFNALYGVPPMYVITPDNWDEQKKRIFKSYKIAAETAKLTGMSEMTDFKILTSDRTVQQTKFANGVTVTVNFGAKPFKMNDGHLLPPKQKYCQH